MFEVTLNSGSFVPDAGRPLQVTELSAVDIGSTTGYLIASSIPDSIDLVTDGNTGRASFNVMIDNDGIYRGWGQVRVSLADGVEYTASTTESENTLEVVIEEDEMSTRDISISAFPQSVVEGDPFTITLTADEAVPTGQSINIELEVVGDPAEFYDSYSTPIEINDSSTSTNVTINTADSTNHTTNGTISIKVIRGDQYEPETTTATVVNVLAKETLPKVSIVDPTPAMIEEGETAQFTVNAMNPDPTEEISVSIEVSQGSGEDFLTSTNPNTVRLVNGTGIVEVNTTPDKVDENNGTITVTLQSDPLNTDPTMDATYLLGNKTTASISVLDNDDPDTSKPSVTISGPANAEEGDTLTYTVTADPAPAAGTSISVRVRITETGSYLTDSAPVNAPRVEPVMVDDSGIGEFMLTTMHDAVDEENAEIIARIIMEDSATKTYSIGQTPLRVTDIVDNDDDALPQINITPNAATVTETAPPAELAKAIFTVTATAVGGSTSAVAVTLIVSQEGNFLANAAGERPIDVTPGTPYPHEETIANDDSVEDDGKIIVRIKSSNNYSVGANAVAEIVVNDDDGLPVITFDTRTFMGNEGNPPASGAPDTPVTLTLNVGLSKATSDPVAVNYTIGDDTDSATWNDDYTATNRSDTVNFAPNDTTEKPISITVTKDVLYEENEELTVTFSLSSGSNPVVRLPANPVATGRINNDDDKPTVSIADNSGVEGNPGDNNDIQFTVTLSEPAGVDVKVNYETTDGTATAGVDYTGVPIDPSDLNASKGELIIPASDNSGSNTNMSGTFDIDVTGDNMNEQDETFTVTISTPSDANATLGNPAMATGTIVSDDLRAFVIADGMITEGNSGDTDTDMTFAVTLSSGNTDQVETVKYRTVANTARADDDFIAPTTDNTLIFTPNTNTAKSQNITIKIVGDDVFELEETFTVELFDNDTTRTILLDDTATGTITDNDAEVASTIGVTAKNLAVTEGDRVEFEFTSNPELAQNLPIKVSFTKVGNFLTSDPTTTKMITIPANTSLTTKYLYPLTTKTANSDIEVDGAVTLTIQPDTTNNTYAVHGTESSATVRIEDFNTPTGVSVLAISDDAVTEGEMAQFEIKAKTSDTTERDVNISVDDGTANFLDSSDRGTRTVKIPTNNRALVLDVPIASDGTFETNGNITVTIEDPSVSSAFQYTISSKNSASVSVYDNDAPGTTADPSMGISIIAVSSPVTEAANTFAEFQVIAKSVSNSIERTIKVRVDNAIGDDFIDPNQDATPNHNFDSQTNIFEVLIPISARFGLLRVKIHEDSKNEDNGSIMATVVNGTGYTPADSNTTATIAIHDNDDEVPVLSISSSAADNGVTEGLSFSFVVTADAPISGGSALTFLKPFLMTDQPSDASNPISPSIVETTFEIADGQREATFTVNLADNGDVTASDSVNIIVRLREDDHYDTSDRDSINVRVKDNDTPSASKPIATLFSVVNYATKSGKLLFLVSLSPPPAVDTDVVVDVEHRNAQNGGLTTLKETVMLSPTRYARTFEFDYQGSGSQGFASPDNVVATIREGENYVLSNESINRTRSLLMLNELPVLSLSEIDSVNEADGKFKFKVISNYKPQTGFPITINPIGFNQLSVMDANSEAPQYAPQIITDPIQITNSSADNSVEVEVTFTKDANYERWDHLTIALVDGAEFTADPNANSRRVLIIEEQTSSREISISAPQSVVEGDDFEITLTASEALSAGESIDIELEVVGNPVEFYESHSTSITIDDSSPSTKATIMTGDSTTHTDNGTISVKVLRGNQYEPATPDATVVNVLAKETLPKVTIADPSPAMITEGTTAMFAVTASSPTPSGTTVVAVMGFPRQW